MKKKICWITADYFADCDFVPIKEVAKSFQVTWIIVFTRKPRYLESDFDSFKKECPYVNIIFIHQKAHLRDLDPTIIFDNCKIAKCALKQKADYFYLNKSMVSLWSFVLWNKLKKQKIIVTSHQGQVHAGFNLKLIAKYSRKYIYGNAKIVHMFSKSQASLFHKEFPNQQIFLTNLALKDFGISSIRRRKNENELVRFLSFGIINYGKLIDAACILYEQGVNNFKVSINGKCDNWDYYQNRIKYPEIFECNIKMLPNSDIPNLFASSHYFVQPYRIVTQSGPMKIAFNYNVPVIASNLPGFADEMIEGTTGYLFESENVHDLVRVMKMVIDNHSSEYDKLRDRMRVYVNDNYSNIAIGRKYIEMFNLLQ